MKNVVFWDIKTQFVLHRRHITSPLQSPASSCYVRFDVLTTVAMKNVVFWDVTPCSSFKNRRFGGTYLHHLGAKESVYLCTVFWLLLTTNVVSSSLSLSTLMIVAMHSSATSVLTWATRRYVPDNGILPSHRSENLKSCIALNVQQYSRIFRFLSTCML
jgi:hypothetical protein